MGERDEERRLRFYRMPLLPTADCRLPTVDSTDYGPRTTDFPLADRGAMTRAKRTIIRVAALGILLLLGALIFAPYFPALVTTLLLVAAIAVLTFALALALKARAERRRR